MKGMGSSKNIIGNRRARRTNVENEELVKSLVQLAHDPKLAKKKSIKKGSEQKGLNIDDSDNVDPIGNLPLLVN